MILDLEGAGHLNVQIWGHSHARPQGNAQGDGVVDTYDIACTDSNEQKLAFRWRDVEEVVVKVANVTSIFPNSAFLASKKVRRFKLYAL